MQHTARKTIAFDTGMIHEAEYFARSYHMDFSDFTRYTLSQKLEELRKREQEITPTFSEETSRAIIQGKREYQEGKTKSFKNGTELMKYLRSKSKK